VSELPQCIPAHIIPLPPEVAAAILAAYPILERIYFARLRETDGNVSNDDIWHRVIGSISSEHSSALDEFFTSLPLLSEGCFVRLSTRSPKDCLLKLESESLKITTPQQALYTVCSSNRVASDLSRTKEVAIVIRPWVSLFDWSEMRVFVSNGKVTAASRYSQAFVESEKLREREKAMLEFVEKVLHCLPDDVTCVVDLGLRKSDEQWVLIELNPFGRQTSGCLFSWTDDGEILRNGPYCFRV
jgi:hypothetical protein